MLSGLTLALGFAVQVALAAALGTGRAMDVYLVAVTLPTLLAVMALAVFPFYLVPALKACAAAGREEEAAALAGWVTRRTALAALALVAALAAAAGPAVRLVAPGLAAGETRRAVTLLRIMLAGSFFDLLRGVLTAVEYARESFVRPQLAPSFNHAVLLASVLFLLGPLGLEGLAAGWALGSLVMFLAMLPALRGVRLLPGGGPLPAFAASAIRRGLPPIVTSAGLAQLSPVVDRRRVAPAAAPSRLGDGSNPPRSDAHDPDGGGVDGVSRAQRARARGDRDGLVRASGEGMRMALLGWRAARAHGPGCSGSRSGVCSSAGRRGRGHVHRRDGGACTPRRSSRATAANVLTQVCFALRRTWLLAGVLAASLLATVALDLGLARLLGFAGVALAFLLVSAMQALLLWGYLRFRRRLQGAATPLPFAGQLALACAAMGGVWAGLHAAAGSWAAGRPAFWLGLNVVAGGAAFAGALWGARNAEARAVAAAVSRAVWERRPGVGA